MPSALEEVGAFFDRNGATLGILMAGARELFEQLAPQAQAQGVSIAHLLDDDVVVVRQLADAAGLAAIAGRRGVSADGIFEAAMMLVKLGGVLAAVA